MKKVIASILAVFFLAAEPKAQTELPPLDKSPMDMSYFPNNYPTLRIKDQVSESPSARVIYSRPQKSGRNIFGDLVKYGDVWRLGANEATEIQFFRNVRIGGKRIMKGRYTLYAIVNENTWTIIINKDVDIWGAFKYDPKKDLVRTDIPVQKTDAVIESLVMVFEKTNTGCNLTIAWDNTKVALPVLF